MEKSYLREWVRAPVYGRLSWLASYLGWSRQRLESMCQSSAKIPDDLVEDIKTGIALREMAEEILAWKAVREKSHKP